MPKKIMKLDTDFRIELIYGPETLSIPVIILETMSGGKIALSLEQVEQFEAGLPKLKAKLAKMIKSQNDG